MSEKRMKQISAKLVIPTDKPNKNGRIYSDKTIKEWMQKMRTINEEVEETHKDLKTPEDQPREERSFEQELEPFRVMVEFIPLEVYDDYVFWGGSVDNGIKFTYRVPAKSGELGYKFSYDKDEFMVDDADNKPITDAIINYYNKFYQYWRDNNQWREGIFSGEEGGDNEEK